MGRMAVVGKSGKFFNGRVGFAKFFLQVTGKAKSTEKPEFLRQAAFDQFNIYD